MHETSTTGEETPVTRIEEICTNGRVVRVGRRQTD
jgi:hypothetical protein